jgi:hypothetical protein
MKAKKTTEKRKAEPSARPKAKSLVPALAAEKERFRLCLEARMVLRYTAGRPNLQRLDDSPCKEQRWHCNWQQQLFDAGFQLAQHFRRGVDQSAYTHPKLAFDAVLSPGLGLPSCDIYAYHRDGTVTMASNLVDVISPEFTPPSRTRKDFKGASAAELVEHLKELVQGKEILSIDADSFGTRYTELLTRLNAESRERAEHLLQTPSILIDGSPPRYERLGCYLDFSNKENRAHTTESDVRYWKEQFSKADAPPPDSTSQAMQAAVWLVAICHMQFAAAPDPSDFLGRGSDCALAHFEALRRAPTSVLMHARFQLQDLLHGLLLCALAGRWQTFKAVCDVVQPDLMSAKRDEYDDLDYAEVLLLFVSSYRENALPKVAALEKSIRKRLAKRPRLLLDICNAIASGEPVDVTEALRTSLENFLEERGQLAGPKANNLFRYIALPESLFQLAALNRGLKLPTLPLGLAEMLITPETIQLPTTR